MKGIFWGALALAAAATMSAPAAGQAGNWYESARQAGQIGERYDGYLGFVTAPSPALRRQVGAINIKRRNLFIGLARQRNVTAQVAGIATGCELLGRVQVGDYYMLGDGVWRRRQAGQTVPLPRYCGS